MNNKDKANKAIQLVTNISNMQDAVDYIRDADTILADIMDDSDFEEQIGAEILEQYLTLSNKREQGIFENLFYSLTGVEFSQYLDMVIEETIPQK